MSLDHAVPYMAGGLFALGWWIFADAIIIQAAKGYDPPIVNTHYIPGIVGTIGLLMGTLIPTNILSGDVITSGYGTSNGCGRLWAFLTFIVSISSIIAGVGIMGTVASTRDALVDDQHDWPGLAIVLQTVLIFSSTMMWLVAKAQHREMW